MKKKIKQKAFVNLRQQALFFCHACKDSHFEDVSQYMDAGQVVVVSHDCRCGQNYAVELERRKMIRRAADLPGTYAMTLPSGIRFSGKINIKDISLGGLGVEFLDGQEVEIGDVLNVSFNLNKGYGPYIKQMLVVRNIRGDKAVGMEFGSAEIVDRAIGTFMVQAGELRA